jgi:hypothetical protein
MKTVAIGGTGPSGTTAEGIRLPAAAVQPMAAPAQGFVEIAGPERLPLSALVGRFLALGGDTRAVTADLAAHSFGALLEADTQVPRGTCRTGAMRCADWCTRQAA